ncbi:DUF4244 domain-containing protein [Kribbella sp. NPDC048928]|uniref:DUF4244 domain-containing protein n=1 Tax=Kribbella sp. NPDC048928 TaxID=3364111 RepID=UPI0037189A5C
MPKTATATSNLPTLPPTTRRALSQRLYAKCLQRVRRACHRGITRRRARTQLGAITAEYAIMIVGACAIGGVLVSLLRSPAMQNALKAIINYGLKLAGVEGVHL